MARLPQKVTLEFVGWSQAVKELLGPLADRDQLFGADGLEGQAMTGQLRILGATCEGELVAAAALRVDTHPHGKELVIVAAAGRMSGGSLIDTIQPIFDRMAADAGCVAIRAHSHRLGMGRVLARHGFAPIETVYRKHVHVGRLQ